MNLLKNIGLVLVACLISMPAYSRERLKISGKIRVLEPVTIRLENIEGEVMDSVAVGRDGVFEFAPREIEPDVYLLCFGEVKQPVYLTNTEVTIKGFYNSRNVAASSLEFSGIDAYREIVKWLPKEEFSHEKTIDAGVKGQLTGNMYSALAYVADMTTYEPNKLLLDCMTAEALETASGRWLQHRTDSLYHYTIGAEAYNFSLQDERGEMVTLSDFRGKLVLVDFWASWCGPCRAELKKLLPIYEELKGDDLVFISISLDTKEEHWRKALAEERLPWVTLRDNERFIIGNQPNTLQRAYGFYSIPFIVLIDQEGRVIGRDLRGEKVREAILQARNGKE